METTTNYGLKKYQAGDLFNPLTVNNPNFDDIDTDMKAISDRAIGRATELVSQGVHAITISDTDCKTFKFVATGNYSAGETFTVNGIQCNAYTPSGSALVSNAFVTGSIVIGSLNEDGTAITFYVTGSAVADDSLKLGGELPSYYATQTDMTSAKTDIDNLKTQCGNTSIAGIGDGTLSGAVSQLNNDLSDNSKSFKFAFRNSEYGYLDSSNVFHPFKSGLEETTLWTNSSPSSSFPAKDITLNSSTSNFEYIKIVFKHSTGSQTREVEVIASIQFYNNTTGGNDTLKLSAGFVTANGDNCYRFANKSNDTTIHFNNANRTSGGSVSSSTNVLIPYKVIGLK